MKNRLNQMALIGAIVLSSLGVSHASVVQTQAAATVAVQQAQRASLVAELRADSAQKKAQAARAKQQFAESELRRVRNNSERLLKMNPYMQKRVAAVLRDLEGHNHRPLIDAKVFRSPDEQRTLYLKGYSQLLFSYHNGFKIDARTGKVLPDSHAADVVDAVKFWNAERVFWLKLARSAQAHGLESGVLWFYKKDKQRDVKRKRLQAALDARDWKYSGPLGWDIAHIQVKGLSLSQLRNGVRLK